MEKMKCLGKYININVLWNIEDNRGYIDVKSLPNEYTCMYC